MPSGAGALGDRDSIFQIKLNPTWNNTATGVLPSFVGSIHYQPIVTALGAARHVAMWMETGENLFNTVSGKSAIGTFNPSGSAKFDVASTTQGAIFPRMTTAQRDSIGYISSITVTAGGSGYGAVYPTVTISGGSGSGATAYSNLASGAVTTVQIINPGIQYFGTAPTVAFGGPGSGTTATAVVHGPDNGLTIYNTTIDSLQYFNGTAWLNIGVNGLIRYKHTIFTPTTGGTVALVNGQYNIINPAGTLATLTVNLPSSPADRDVVYIKFTQIVTTVTYGNGTIVDGIVSPAAGGLVVLTYDSGTTSWY
jgi:hypothetical protein